MKISLFLRGLIIICIIISLLTTMTIVSFSIFSCVFLTSFILKFWGLTHWVGNKCWTITNLAFWFHILALLKQLVTRVSNTFLTAGVNSKQESQCSLFEELVLRFFTIFVHSVTNGRKITILLTIIIFWKQKAGDFWFIVVVWENYLKHGDVKSMRFLWC